MTGSVVAAPPRPSPFPARGRSPPRSCGSTTSTSSSTIGSSSCWAAKPTLTELGVFSALWSEHCSYKHSKPVLQTLPDHRSPGRAGAGRERRRPPPAGRLGGRLQDRVAQPSLRGRAVPGRGHRGRRHPARRLHHGRAPGRGAQQPPASVRSTSRATATSSPASCAASATTATASASPPSAGEVDFAPGYTGNPLVNAMCVGLLREDDLIRAAAARRGQRAARGRCPHRARRHPRRELRLGGAVREERVAPPAGAGGRPLHREAAARSEPRAHHLRSHRGDPGHGRRGPHQLERRDGGARRRRRRDRHRPGPDPRGRDDALRDPACRSRRSGCWWWPTPERVAEVQRGLREVGADRHADRSGDRRRDLPGEASRAHRRRDPGPAPGGRLPDLPSRGPRERGSARPPCRPTGAPAEGGSAACARAAPRHARASRASAGSTSSTTPRCRPPPSFTPAATPACSASPGRRSGSP